HLRNLLAIGKNAVALQDERGTCGDCPGGRRRPQRRMLHLRQSPVESENYNQWTGSPLATNANRLRPADRSFLGGRCGANSVRRPNSYVRSSALGVPRATGAAVIRRWCGSFPSQVGDGATYLLELGLDGL